MIPQAEPESPGISRPEARSPDFARNWQKRAPPVQNGQHEDLESDRPWDQGTPSGEGLAPQDLQPAQDRLQHRFELAVQEAARGGGIPQDGAQNAIPQAR